MYGREEEKRATVAYKTVEGSPPPPPPQFQAMTTVRTVTEIEGDKGGSQVKKVRTWGKGNKKEEGVGKRRGGSSKQRPTKCTRQRKGKSRAGPSMFTMLYKRASIYSSHQSTIALLAARLPD